MPKHFQIGWCPHDRMSDWQRFVDRNWRRDHILARDGELLHWQHIHPELPNHFSILIAELDSEIVGTLGLIFQGFAAGGRRYPGVMLALWLAREEFRRDALGLQLLKAVLDKPYSFVGVLGANATALALFRSLRFAVYEEVPRWIGVFSPRCLRSMLAADPDPSHQQSSGSWLNQIAISGAENTSSDGIELAGWNRETAAAWNRAWVSQFSRSLCGTWRDAEFMEWRYASHPRFHYDFRLARDVENGEILGLLVYRLVSVQDRPERVLRIVEFLATERCGPMLANEVCRIGVSEEVAFADFYCTSEQCSRHLKRAGFVSENQQAIRFPALFSPLDFRRSVLTGAFRVGPEIAPESGPYFAETDVYFTRSDGDQDRPN